MSRIGMYSLVYVFHTCRFIPGTSASDVHYQAYLIDGITRWNKDRASAFLGGNTQSPRTFDIALQQKVLTDNNMQTCMIDMYVPCYRSIHSARRSLEGQSCHRTPFPTNTLGSSSVCNTFMPRAERNFQQ